MVFASDILTGRTDSTSTIGTLFADLKRGIAQRNAYHRTVRELSHLSDHALADLGMSRGQITTVAHKAIYGKSA